MKPPFCALKGKPLIQCWCSSAASVVTTESFVSYSFTTVCSSATSITSVVAAVVISPWVGFVRVRTVWMWEESLSCLMSICTENSRFWVNNLFSCESMVMVRLFLNWVRIIFWIWMENRIWRFSNIFKLWSLNKWSLNSYLGTSRNKIFSGFWKSEY